MKCMTQVGLFAPAPEATPPELSARVERYIHEGMDPDVAPKIARIVAANERRAGHGGDDCAACAREGRGS